ncbi:hypothetical protein JCM10049v2_006884 [Rhodotorula toruloides]
MSTSSTAQPPPSSPVAAEPPVSSRPLVDLEVAEHDERALDWLREDCMLTLRLLIPAQHHLWQEDLNEYIALGTYGLVGLGAWAATRGGSDAKKADDSKLDITSQTDDKEMIAFIENFINNEEHKAKSAGGH